MKTYQDLIAVGENEEKRMKFIEDVISSHKASDAYRIAGDAEEYAKQNNPTIMRYQKWLYTLSGKAVPDTFSSNHKCASNFFYRFVTQENQYLLGNGVNFDKDDTKDKLGGSDFDYQLQNAGFKALIHGVSFGFYNLNKIQIFSLLEFAPLYDEEDGSLKAGVRFWQISPDKPLRATLYELDGYTNYIKRKSESMQVLYEKKPYVINEITTEADGVLYTEGENYPSFPIVPLYSNQFHQSEIVGIRSQIDAYDLIKSGFANDIDDASVIYWTIQNAGGMDDLDLAKFVERMKTVRATVIDDEGARAESHTQDVPTVARETFLTRLEDDLYNDFMALNVHKISAGSVTATQIMSAYEPLNNKADQYEYCVIDFIKAILELAGIEDEPTFTRSQIVNQTEITEMVLQASSYLDEETIVELLPFLTPEQKEKVKAKREAEDIQRFVDTVDYINTEEGAE